MKSVDVLREVKSLELDENAIQYAAWAQFAQEDRDRRDALVREAEGVLAARHEAIAFSYDSEVATHAEGDADALKECVCTVKRDREVLEHELTERKTSLKHVELDFELAQRRLDEQVARYKTLLDEFKALPKEIQEVKDEIAKLEKGHAELLSAGKIAEAKEVLAQLLEKRRTLDVSDEIRRIDEQLAGVPAEGADEEGSDAAARRAELQGRRAELERSPGLCSTEELVRRWNALYWAWRESHLGNEQAVDWVRRSTLSIEMEKHHVAKLEASIAHMNDAKSYYLWRCLAKPEVPESHRPERECPEPPEEASELSQSMPAYLSDSPRARGRGA